MNSEFIADTRGLKCPLPVLRTKKALASLPNGAELSILSTDKNAPNDFQAFCQQTGHLFISAEELDELFENQIVTKTIIRKKSA